MKRIEFLAPVEAIRGNMSGNQVLEYAENNNPAFEAPDGKVNYARNYKPRFIGAKVSASGKCYFQVKTKSASHKTAAYRLQMSLMGGAGAIYASILRHKSSALYGQLEAAYANLPVMIRKPSLRKWLMDILIKALAAKSQAATITVGSTTITINNPWVASSQTSGAEITNDVIGKFFLDLAVDAIAFTINGKQGVATYGEEFGELVGSNHNTLGLTIVQEGGTDYVKLGAEYLLSGADAVTSDWAVSSGASYATTTVAPSA